MLLQWSGSLRSDRKILQDKRAIYINFNVKTWRKGDMTMVRLEIGSFLISCERESIISVDLGRSIKPRGYKRDLSHFLHGIIHPVHSNQCPLFLQSGTFTELRDAPRAQVSIVNKQYRRTTVLRCRPGRTCDAASKQRPCSWLGRWTVTWILFTALLFISRVSSGTSPSQKLFICDRSKYLSPSKVGTRIDTVWI